ncbi:MAG: M15 family metallopeptidase [bacterium]|nr:M15 family metallopeptidase [bacterium]
MPALSSRSLDRLDTCHEDLQRVMRMAIQHGPDFTVLQGHRGEREQEAAFRKGHSKVRFPDSKHNAIPARAVDVAPYPIDWNDLNRFRVLAGFVLGVAAALGVRMRWGGDWDRDFEEEDERFRDLPHFELLDDVGRVVA